MMALKFEKEDFEEWLEQGLKVSHGANLDIDEEISLVPKAPVAFAFVTESAAIDATGEIEMPAMIPLPMSSFTLKIKASSSLDVLFKATWSVRFVKHGHFCDIFFAIPSPTIRGFTQALLDDFKVEIPNCSKPDVKPCSTHERMFDDIYFIQRSQVDGGIEVHAKFRFTCLLPSDRGISAFLIPLNFPFYSKDFCDEQVPSSAFTTSKFRRYKIKVSVSAGVDRLIHRLWFTHPHAMILESEGHATLLHESEGPDVEWPKQTLMCNFMCVDKEAP